MSDLKCTCAMSDNAWNHDGACQLWLSPIFTKGFAFWDPADEELVEYMDEGEPEEAATENKPQRFSWGLKKDEMALAFELSNLDKLLDGLLMDAYESDWSAFNLHGVSWVYNVEQKDYVAQELGCYCGNAESTTGTLIQCRLCGVHRKGKNSRWMPTAKSVLEDEYVCIHDKAYHCLDCQVTRLHPTHPWEPLGDKEYSKNWPPDTFGQSYGTGNNKGGSTSYSSGYSSGGYESYVSKDRHYSELVTFPDGTKLWGSSQHTRTNPKPEELPQWGLYLDPSWSPQCLAMFLPWQDYGLPKVPDSQIVQGITMSLEMAKRGYRVEVGCIGGHGRTGTALAMMATLCGVKPDEAVKWVRENYCKHAVETEQQEWLPLWFHATVNGYEAPPKPVPPPSSAWEYQKRGKRPSKLMLDADDFLWHNCEERRSRVALAEKADGGDAVFACPVCTQEVKPPDKDDKTQITDCTWCWTQLDWFKEPIPMDMFCIHCGAQIEDPEGETQVYSKKLATYQCWMQGCVHYMNKEGLPPADPPDPDDCLMNENHERFKEVEDAKKAAKVAKQTGFKGQKQLPLADNKQLQCLHHSLSPVGDKMDGGWHCNDCGQVEPSMAGFYAKKAVPDQATEAIKKFHEAFRGTVVEEMRTAGERAKKELKEKWGGIDPKVCLHMKLTGSAGAWVCSQCETKSENYTWYQEDRKIKQLAMNIKEANS